MIGSRKVGDAKFQWTGECGVSSIEEFLLNGITPETTFDQAIDIIDQNMGFVGYETGSDIMVVVDNISWVYTDQWEQL